MQRTLVMVKPDGVSKNLIGTVLQRFEKAGLKAAGLKLLKLSRERAEGFYAEHKGKPFYPPLIDFMTSGPIVAVVWEGPDAIKKARELMGATDSKKAEPGTLRRDFGTDNRMNLVHGSDSPESAQREIQFHFKPDELVSSGDHN